MDDLNIEIIDDNELNQNNVNQSNTQLDNFNEPQNAINNNSINEINQVQEQNQIEDLSKTVTIDTLPQDKKAAKKILKERAKQAKLEKKLRKKNKNLEATTSNVASNQQVVDIVETAVTTGSSGSQVIGSIEGSQISANNSPLPSPIDITIRQKVNAKDNTKRVKIVTKTEKVITVLVYIFIFIIAGLSIFAAYYFGYKTNPALFSVKNLQFELGSDIPSAVSNYINKQNQADDLEYTLDLSRVNKDIEGTYTYTVTRKNTTKTGQIVIKDTIPPELVLKDSESLVFTVRSKITKEDLVESCTDLSNCNYNLEYQVDTEEQGDKTVNIIAKDDVGNTTSKSIQVKVINISKTLVCTSEKTTSDDETYYIEIVDTLNFDDNDNLVSSSGAKRYTYNDFFAYFSKIKEFEGNDNYSIDQENNNYSENIKASTNNLISFKDLRNYYVEKGYKCK